MEKIYRYREGMMIECTLKRSNPPEVNYNWYSLDTTIWKLTEKLPILRLDSQSKLDMKYKCRAENTVGSTSKIIEVVKDGVCTE
ncbi:---NA---, partial [Paramuricea clavata]